MTNTYFIPIDSDDVQDAISTELGFSVDEATAQEVLDTFIEPTQVTATVGCSAQEECLSMMLSLMKQIGDNKASIMQIIAKEEAEP